MNGYVYVLTDGKHFKIGYTTNDNPNARRYACQVGNATQLELVAAYWCENAPAEELALHREFQHKRIIRRSGFGEWFELNKADLQTIEEKHNAKRRNDNPNTPLPVGWHPAYHVRPVSRRQQNQAGAIGQTQFERVGERLRSYAGAFLSAGCSKHAIGGQAFLGKTGA